MNAPQRSAIVTGAAGGIGAAVARLLVARGVRVMLADRNDAVLAVAESVSAAGGTAIGCVVDLAIEKGVSELAQRVNAQFGGCDILVNNAGINPKRNGEGYRLEDIDTDTWCQVLRVNLTAPFLLCRELMPGMRDAGWGRVINIASRAGRSYIPGVSSFYSVSKAGLIGLTRQLAGEFAASGVTVNCVAPGPVETPLSLQSSREVRAKVTAAIPVGRSGTAEEIAAAVDFLASDAARYVCGACLDVNGGGFMG